MGGAKRFFLIFLILPALLLACGGGGSGNPEGTPPSGDVVILSIDGGANSTYTESAGVGTACDPRVDWASGTVQLFDNFLGGTSFETIFFIMFPPSGTSVQTYDISTDQISVQLNDSTGTYTAHQFLTNSSGTVEVTRVDTRIEGTFNVVLVDTTGNPGTGPTLTGSFGVDSGNSLTCP